MNTVSKLLCVVGLAGFTASASAQVLWFPFTVSSDKVSIPDNDLNGEALFGTVSGFADDYKISTNNFKVVLEFAGDPIASNGDLYAALQAPNGGPIAVLMNRVGYGAGELSGYADNGGKFVFYDGATDPNNKDDNGTAWAFSDVHNYQNDPVFGTGGKEVENFYGIFNSDGRSVDPQGSIAQFAAANRNKTLAVFQGLNPNGEWTLFLADVANSGFAKVVSWGLDFTPIPEPQEYAIAVGLGLLGFAVYRRRTLKIA